MKAKKVYEFRQGENPYKTMSIGANRPIKVGDRFKCITNVYWSMSQGCWIRQPDSARIATYQKGKIYEISYIYHSGVGIENNYDVYEFQFNDLEIYFDRI
jgi:hypothetical protein